MRKELIIRNKSIVQNLLDKLMKEKTLSIREYKLLLEKNYQFFYLENDAEIYNLGLSVICHVAESNPEDMLINELLYDNIVASRVFLYEEMYRKVTKKKTEINSLSFIDEVAKSYYALESGTVLTKEQKRLLDDFQKYRRLVVSAPTSFGKSRIISEIIINNNYQNIAIVLPTIALLNETYLSFKKNQLIQGYNLITSVTNDIQDKNIFILTPEKMDMLLDQYPLLEIDFFVMDEIYKIQDGDERNQVFTYCLYRLSKMDADFYLIGPYFEGFSKKFLEKTNAKFRKYSAEIVQKQTYDFMKIDFKEEIKIDNNKIKKLKDKDRNLVNLLRAVDNQTLVYMGRKDTVENRAKKIAREENTDYNNDLVEYIKQNIANDWSLVDCLKKGIGFHHSAIPKYIQTEIVESFNNGLIKTLVCTSTLTEGVNTTAKNVIIYDNFKGKKSSLLSGFDVKNIKGRAGRFLEHFVGRVILLDTVSAEEEKGELIFNYYDLHELSSDETILVDKSDLDDTNKKKRETVENQLAQENIDISLIKKSKFIPIHKQVSLVNYLRENDGLIDYLQYDSNLPSKNQLSKIIEICHCYLFNKQDFEDKGFSLGNLTRLTNYYVYLSPSIKDLIKTQNGKNTDTKIRNAFKLISHYFEYALPKYLSCFETILKYVCHEKNKVNTFNLKYLITKLEFGFVENHEIAMKEAGVPLMIIQKISRYLKDCNNIQQINIKIKLNPQILNVLSSYEQKILSRYV